MSKENKQRDGREKNVIMASLQFAQCFADNLSWLQVSPGDILAKSISEIQLVPFYTDYAGVLVFLSLHLSCGI